ncbi:MAG: hypothetical protein MUC38_06945 [Cyclobacteriaceae bacterium]|jgi:hypothetical protein|nr:hypothetical protein [Cyclobacteriaceae bacterium]
MKIRIAHVLALTGFMWVSAFLATAQTVYSAAHGKKYHTADCRLSGDAEGMTRAAARKAGKSACNICQPNRLGNAKLSPCSGQTADGTRCKRLTANRNKKCFQHQG